MTIIMSFVGIATLITLAVLLSNNRQAINHRTVIAAFILQAAIAAFTLYLPWGQTVLGAMVDAVQNVIDYGKVGIEFLFGDLGKGKLGFIIAFNVLPMIIFISALMSTLYHLGIMQKVVIIIGGLLERILGTNKPESLCAAANIFVGHTESPLVVRPYLNRMSDSSLFAILTAGMATIAGPMMAGYAAMGIDLNYLIAASFMAAPGGLLMAKLIYPETATQEFNQKDIDTTDSEKAATIIEAISNGAIDGVKVALNVGAILIAFVAMIALVNGIIGGIAGLFDYEDITLQLILGKLLAPLMFLLSIPWEEATEAGSMVGQKFILTEFIAYLHFLEVRDTLSFRTQAMMTFGLCGFGNIASLGMMLGVISTVTPKRKQAAARMGIKAIIAGCMTSLMSGVLAGLFISLQG